MRYDRRLVDALGLAHPIVQAPMGGGTTPQLVAEVANAGGLGSLGTAMHAADAIREHIRALRALTGKAFAVNLFTYTVPPADPARTAAMKARIAPFQRALGSDPEHAPAMPPLPRLEDQIAAILDEPPPVLSFTFGLPERAVIAAMRAKGIYVIGTATTVAEARAVEAAGCDAVVAQGYEAGGHRGTFAAPVEDSLVGLFALLPQIVDAVKVPVLAAGGIMDGRGVAAALALGAAAAQIGTAFLVCPENDIVHPVWRTAILDRDGPATVLSRAYTGRHCRFIRNRYLDSMAGLDDAIPAYPHQMAAATPVRALAAQQGAREYLAMLVGQGYPMARAMPAAELVRTLMREVEEVVGGTLA